jgi:hypothetical protein
MAWHLLLVESRPNESGWKNRPHPRDLAPLPKGAGGSSKDIRGAIFESERLKRPKTVWTRSAFSIKATVDRRIQQAGHTAAPEAAGSALEIACIKGRLNIAGRDERLTAVDRIRPQPLCKMGLVGTNL